MSIIAVGIKIGDSKAMNIETKRLVITEFTLDMAYLVHENSMDEDNRRFVPDEVWETVEEAEETLGFLNTAFLVDSALGLDLDCDYCRNQGHMHYNCKQKSTQIINRAFIRK